MEAIQRIVRCYGIKKDEESSFCSLFKECIDKPIEKVDYPRKNEKIEIHIGKPIDSIIKSDKVRLATGGALQQKRFGLRKEDDLKTVIIDVLGTLPHASSDYNYFITLILEKKIEIDDKDVLDRECYWLDFKTIDQIDVDLIFYANKCFDVLITHLSFICDIDFFNNIIIDNKTFISTSGKQEIGILHFGGSGKATVITNNAINYDELKDLIDDISENLKAYNWLGPITHLKLAAARDEDVWKHYYLSFNAMELLIEGYVKRAYEKIKCQVKLEKKDGTYLDLPSLPMEIMKDKKEFNLSEKFGIMALELFPEDVERDYELFSKLKKQRDSMSHGRPVNNNELQTAQIDSILNKYLNKIMENITNDEED